MPRGNKILTIIFVILISVILLELGYYYIYFVYNKKDNSLSLPNKLEDRDFSIPVPTPIPLGNSQLAIDMNNVNVLLSAKKGLLISSTVTNIYQGRIKIINLKGGITQKLNYKYKAGLVLEGKNNVTNNFYFNDESLKKLIVLEKKGNTETPSKIDNLKVGDNINIREVLDLTRNLAESVIETTIIKE